MGYFLEYFFQRSDLHSNIIIAKMKFRCKAQIEGFGDMTAEESLGRTQALFGLFGLGGIDKGFTYNLDGLPWDNSEPWAIVAIIIGLAVLHEADGAPFGAYIGFAAAGALAVTGVFLLARFHPEVVSNNSAEVPIVRGSGGDGEPRTNSEKLTDAVAKVWPEPPVRDRDDPRRR